MYLQAYYCIYLFIYKTEIYLFTRKTNFIYLQGKKKFILLRGKIIFVFFKVATRCLRTPLFGDQTVRSSFFHEKYLVG